MNLSPEERLAKIAELLREAVCTGGEDEGVILLDNQGRTQYDPELKCQVYVNQYFSPLGDNLIACYKLTQPGGGDDPNQQQLF